MTDAAIVTLIGAVDRFTVSTMPKNDPNSDIITEYDSPAEMMATGEYPALCTSMPRWRWGLPMP